MNFCNKFTTTLILNLLFQLHSVQSKNVVKESTFNDESTRLNEKLLLNLQPGVPIKRYGLNYAPDISCDLNCTNVTPKNITDHLLNNDLYLLGIGKTASKDDFLYQSTRKTAVWSTVRYSQVHNNIPVYDADLALTVNQNNVVTLVLGTYMNGVFLQDPTHQMNSSNVENTIFQTYGEKNVTNILMSNPELVIVQFPKQSILAWKVLVDYMTDDTFQSLEIIINDNNGTVLQEKSLIHKKV